MRHDRRPSCRTHTGRGCTPRLQRSSLRSVAPSSSMPSSISADSTELISTCAVSGGVASGRWPTAAVLDASCSHHWTAFSMPLVARTCPAVGGVRPGQWRRVGIRPAPPGVRASRSQLGGGVAVPTSSAASPNELPACSVCRSTAAPWAREARILAGRARSSPHTMLRHISAEHRTLVCQRGALSDARQRRHVGLPAAVPAVQFLQTGRSNAEPPSRSVGFDPGRGRSSGRQRVAEVMDLFVAICATEWRWVRRIPILIEG